jgi:membrane-associated phospholipid phosphatase
MTSRERSHPPQENEIVLALRWTGENARCRESWWRTLLQACGPFERLTLAYLSFLNLLILLFHRNLPGAPFFVLGHAALGGAIIALVAAARKSQHPVLVTLRNWYPMVLFLFFFEELHYLVHLVVPDWFDSWLICFDYALLGVHPTVWIEQFASPWLNDLMQLAYMTYYLFPVVLGVALYRRRELDGFWSVFTGTAVAYYIGYAVSILFPIEGPYHTLAVLQRVDLQGGFFTAIINWIETFGRVHGAAFPSAHVSGSLVALLGAWRFRRRLFWLFLPFFLLMLVATVYGRYHYVADVFAGLLVGATGFRVGVDTGRRKAAPTAPVMLS